MNNREKTWNDFLNDIRIRESFENENENKSVEVSVYNQFDRDYARMIYSSSVRRLQDKTQVFPLQKNDFIRTRLTHSLEVSSLAESMGWQIGEILQERKTKGFKNWKELKRLPSILKVTGLLHDLGNPPFGHFGEDVIKMWFKDFFDEESKSGLKYEDYKSDTKEILENQKNDFRYFDGNAQTIRILSILQFLNDKYGSNVTLATLAVLMKYPWSSDEAGNHKEKFGYMNSEKGIFDKIVKNNIFIEEGKRHPVTYILEAADDIAYKLADIEDAVKKGLFNWCNLYTKEFRGKLKKSVDSLSSQYEYSKYKGDYTKRFEQFSESIASIKEHIPNYDLICVQNFKSFMQTIMVYVTIHEFFKNYDKIINGTFDRELLDVGALNNILENIKTLTHNKVFPAKEILGLELAGDVVITNLLNLFVPAILRIKDTSKTRERDQKLVRMISENFLYVQYLKKEDNSEGWLEEIPNLSDYEKIQIVVDYISGMTDSFAMDLNKRLLGMNI